MLKDAFYSLGPVNFLLRCIALSNVYRKGNELAESGSVIKSAIYIVLFGILNIFCLCNRMKKFNGNIQTGIVRFSDSVQLAYWISYLEYVIDMYCVFIYGRLMILRYFKGLDQIDSILGVCSCNDMRKTIISTVILAVAIFTFVSTFDYVCWVLLEGWHVATICAVDYLYFLLSMLTVLDILSHVVQVEYRLKNIRELLQNGNTANLIECFVEDTKAIISVRAIENKQLTSLKILCDTKYYEAAWFIRCYLMLLDQVNYINASYGFRVLVFCVNLLINMINLLNLAIRIFNGTMQFPNATRILAFLSSVSSTMRAWNYASVMIILMYRCEQAYKESASLLATIDLLLTTKRSSDNLKINFLEFRNLIITRPIKFHAVKFFNMDYTLLVSLSSVVVTYTIIMLQSMQ